MTVRLDIINRALVRIGSDPLETESSPGFETHFAIYDSVTEDILSRYPWSFATFTRRLGRLTAAPAQLWKYQFQMPSDMIGVPRAVYDRSDSRTPFADFALGENRLFADVLDIWLTYQKKPDPLYWPGWFRELITVAVMAELALSVREDNSLRAVLRENAYGSEHMMGEGGLLGQAKNMDSQGKASPVIAEGGNPLIDVRY